MEIRIPGISINLVILIFQCGVWKLEWLKHNVPKELVIYCNLNKTIMEDGSDETTSEAANM